MSSESSSKPGPEQTEIGYGGSSIRIDCLRELIAFHDLPGAAAAKVEAGTVTR